MTVTQAYLTVQSVQWIDYLGGVSFMLDRTGDAQHSRDDIDQLEMDSIRSRVKKASHKQL